MKTVVRVGVPLLMLFLVLPVRGFGSALRQESLAYNVQESSLLSMPANLQVKRVPIAEALKTLRQRAKVDITFSPSLLPRQKLITCECQGSTVEGALLQILADTGFDFFEMPLQIVIRPPQPSPSRPALARNVMPTPRFAAMLPDLRPSITQFVPRRADVAGVVFDAESREPLRGVRVFVPGTDLEALTDAQGQFRITGVEGTTVTLQVQLIGYTSATVTVSVGDEDVEIALETTAIQLDEVVVTALGVDRAGRALGYSVARADREQMTINRTPNFMNALQGKMAGVTVTPMGTGPQGSSKVRIRGQSSIGANNSPLIVVNGVPIDNTTFGVSGDISERGSNRNSDSGDGLAGINPDDIEEMTVLKGAAAAALYGARAKDGVIMITTRNRAAQPGIQVEFNSNFTMESPLDYRDYQMEYGQGERGERPTDPFPDDGVWSFGERFEPGMTNVLFDGVEVPYEPQPNQLNEFYREGFNATNTVTFSQSGENGGFNLSLSNLSSQAILPGSDYKRNTVNLGFTQRIANRLTVSGNINYSNELRDNPPNIAEQDHSTPVIIYTLANSMPTSLLKEKAFTEEGDEVIWSRFNNRTNPYFSLSRFENNDRDRVYGNITGRFDLTDWMFVQARIGQDYWSRDQEYNLPSGAQVLPPAPEGFANGQYIQDQMTLREVNADVLLSGNRTYGEYSFDMGVGGNVMRRSQERSSVLAQDFYTRGSYNISNGRILDPDFALSERQVNSVYGTAEVSYRNLVFVTGTLRNDWFSTLAPEHRSILYPSVATSFVFTEALSLPDWLSFGKVRAAYAEVGSDTDVPPYADNLFYSINSNLFNDLALASISGNTVPNPDLKPMRLSEWEVGLEATLFENVTFDVGYYNRLSKDQILAQQISNASGYTTQRVNVGETRNAGVEMFLDFSPIRRERFGWNTTLNASYNTSKVLDLGTEIDEDGNEVPVEQISVGNANFHGQLRQVRGQPMNQLFGWGWLRDEETGRQVFNDDGIPMRSEEQLMFGSSLPKWVGGITNRFDYRGVSLSFLIDFQLGHKLISGTHTNAVRHGLDKSTLPGREEGCVVGEGVTQDGAENTTCADIQIFYEAIRTHQTSEQSVFNAGWWQLRQISLGYDFTPHLPTGLGISGLRVNAVANNVGVLKKWVPHIHPEQNGIISDARMGLESTGMPVTRGLGLNVNVVF